MAYGVPGGECSRKGMLLTLDMMTRKNISITEIKACNLSEEEEEFFNFTVLMHRVIIMISMIKSL